MLILSLKPWSLQMRAHMEIDQILGAIKNGWVKPVWTDAMI